MTRSLRVGVAAIAALLVITVAVFVRHLPGGGYELRAVVRSASQITPGSEVRVAGVRVGKVTHIGPGPGDTALVTFTADTPVHADAAIAIRERLILEGNAYLRLDPGSPEARRLPSGATIPLSRTSVPVQLDQVLTTFDAPTRDSLHALTGTLADGLDSAALRADASALDRALPDLGAAASAARGAAPGDLGLLLHAGHATASQLARSPAALADLVTSFDRVTGALADRDAELAATVRGFSETLRAAPASLRALDGALPRLTRFALRLRPALAAAPGSLEALHGLLGQLGGLVGPTELPVTVARLAPITTRLPRLERRLGGLLPQAQALTDCIRERVLPTLDAKLQDGSNTTGDPVYLDMVHGFTGATGAAPSFDGNGVNVRAGVTEGGTAIGGVFPGLGSYVAGGPAIAGVRPTWLGYGVEPPYRPDARCTAQPMPDLTKRSQGAAPTAAAWAQLRKATR